MPAKVTVKSLEGLPSGVHRVERGLYLRKREGRKPSWIFIYQLAGKRREMTLGLVEDISITRARALVVDFRKLLSEGRDPIAARHQAKEELAEEAAREREPALTVEAFVSQASPEIISSRSWRSTRSERRWEIGLRRHILPAIGKMPLAEVNRDAVLKVLRPIWSSTPQTAGAVRGQLEALFDYAIATNRMPAPNPAVWRGNLSFFLSRLPAKQHHEALTVEETRAFLERIRPMRAPVAWAMTFCVLTCSRSGEARGARWDEVDFERAVWSVPPQRRKDGKPYPHRVPLSIQALELLRSIPQTADVIFPRRGDDGAGVDGSSLLYLVRRYAGRGTVHGFRSTFRDWAAETLQDETLAEKCLMHTTGSSVVQAYQRSDLLEQRRPLMQEWADVIMPRG